MNSIVIVLDNAPCHVNSELILKEEEFDGATILRLAPYSAPLNPIEACWSTMKAKFKEIHAREKLAMLNEEGRGHESVTEYRTRYIEGIIDRALPQNVTRTKCLSFINHVSIHYQACLNMEDLPMGV